MVGGILQYRVSVMSPIFSSLLKKNYIHNIFFPKVKMALTSLNHYQSYALNLVTYLIKCKVGQSSFCFPGFAQDESQKLIC